MSDALTPCAKWTPDCQGKWDYDGRIVSISTRYWPQGGGFHILTGGDFRLSNDPSLHPSATASIQLNYGIPDDDGFGNCANLISRDFAGGTEAEVKQAVEAWVSEQVIAIAAVLRSHFGIRAEEQN